MRSALRLARARRVDWGDRCAARLVNGWKRRRWAVLWRIDRAGGAARGVPNTVHRPAFDRYRRWDAMRLRLVDAKLGRLVTLNCVGAISPSLTKLSISNSSSGMSSVKQRSVAGKYSAPGETEVDGSTCSGQY